ncbi:TetR/AcrR family transcriptional regulator [Granulicella sibirica]|uniref:Transcriptional regulator, TetR family n=1 Tax=Granulicella sibirica TaxID=2479048 RepID=A0A4V1L5L3_9BACT|nr:TetR/AcrR family transcriptional regulator [Granulicella sibirica]RXH56164.1 Transcriptional regulator, TetR family [Granulicella sibirica]
MSRGKQTIEAPKVAAKKAGRPREFDIDEALDKAMHLFWEQGYDGTSLAELAALMGITKPSLYAAFSDKQSLFEAALARYSEGPNSFAVRAFRLPTARAVVKALLDGSVNVSTCSSGPRGCMYTQATMANDPEVRDAAAEHTRQGERMLEERFLKAQQMGELPASTDCAALARYYTTVALGITVRGASGSSRSELREVVQKSMHAWPAEVLEWSKTASTEKSKRT